MKFDEALGFFEYVYNSGFELEVPQTTFRQLIARHFNVADTGQISRLTTSFKSLGLIQEETNGIVVLTCKDLILRGKELKRKELENVDNSFLIG